MSDDAAPMEEREEGAPAWVVTFGDLMSLLLCFFVLLLSFSEMDRNKYRVVSGSVRNAFGIQRKKPIFESPKGSKMIAKEFDQAIVLTKLEDVAKPIIKELDEEFEEFNGYVEVETTEKQVTIRMMGEATFDTGKAELRSNFVPLLQEIGKVLVKTRGKSSLPAIRTMSPWSAAPLAPTWDCPWPGPVQWRSFCSTRVRLIRSGCPPWVLANTVPWPPMIRPKAGRKIDASRSL